MSCFFPEQKSISQSNKMETPGTASPYHKSLVFSIEMCSVAEHNIDRTEREKYSYTASSTPSKVFFPFLPSEHRGNHYTIVFPLNPLRPPPRREYVC